MFRCEDLVATMTLENRSQMKSASEPRALFDRGAALPLAYEVSCRTRTGSVRHTNIE